MKFVVLIDFTDKARENPPSMDEMATKMSAGAKSMGATIEQRYWGIGGLHDIVVILDAPDEDTVAKLITRAQMSGYAVPRVMHVWTDEQRAEIVQSAVTRL
jgi:uncharacterized protein with GYD domain